MPSHKIKLTQDAVSAARPESTKYVIWDKEITGFGVEVHPRGNKRYFLKRRFNGRQVRPTFGRHGDMKLAEARKAAINAINMINEGLDPTLHSKLAKEAPTVGDLMDEFVERHVKPNRKPKTEHEYAMLIRNHIKPAMGHLLINEVSPGDVEHLKNKLRQKKTTANRCLEVVSVAFNKGEKWGLREVGKGNPCKHVERFRLDQRKVYLEPDELKVLLDSIRAYREENTFARSAMYAIELIIHTGARRNEIRTLKWAYVDFDKALLRLPDSKTGAKDIVLTTPAIVLLKRLYASKDEGQEYVFSGAEVSTGLSEPTLYKHWARAVNKAKEKGLKKEGLRIHDLRHTFASLGVASGLDLQAIRDLLGHASIATTQRYAHLYDDAKRAAAERIGELIGVAAE